MTWKLTKWIVIEIHKLDMGGKMEEHDKKKDPEIYVSSVQYIEVLNC